MNYITNLRINSNQILQYSTDGGCTWVSLGPVSGNDGADGSDGQNGQDGATPEINPVNKHWIIRGVDTQVSAEGIDGDSPYINQDGYWVVNGQVTQYKATGDTYSLVAETGEHIDDPSESPTVTTEVDRENKVVTFTFDYLKGDKGDKGDPGETGSSPEITTEAADDGIIIYADGVEIGTLSNGPQGPQGPAGLGIVFKENATSCLNPNDGYINSNGELLVRVSATGTAAEFINYGSLVGPQGPRGPQGMWYVKDSYESISSDEVVFDVDGASIGDYLVYSGTSNNSIQQGDVFELDRIIDNVQYWVSVGLNIKGPKGDTSMSNLTETDFTALVTRLRGYPLYSQGDGISIVPNEAGYFVIKARVDNETIKFDSQGNLIVSSDGFKPKGYLWTEIINSFAEGETAADNGMPAALGVRSHAEGQNTTASAAASHAEGYATRASNTTAHAEGQMSEASGVVSHAEGGSTHATASCAHSEGSSTTASGTAAHSEGAMTEASGHYSHAEGNTTTASGECSHAGGVGTIADAEDMTAIGKYNLGGKNNTLFAVGNGTSTNRSDAMRVSNIGEVYVKNNSVYDSYNPSKYPNSATVQNELTISGNSPRYNYLNADDDCVITVNTGSGGYDGWNADSKIYFVMVHIYNSSSNSIEIRVEKTLASSLINMWDSSLTDSTGMMLPPNKVMELCFTFWDRNYASFNGGISV